VNADEKLDEVLVAQLWWKPSQMRDVAVGIVESMLRLGVAYPDEVSLPVLVKEDKNTIGSAWRSLRKMGLVKETGVWRRSGTEAAHGRRIFQYAVASYPLARSFLARNGAPTKVMQQELF